MTAVCSAVCCITCARNRSSVESAATPWSSCSSSSATASLIDAAPGAGDDDGPALQSARAASGRRRADVAWRRPRAGGVIARWLGARSSGRSAPAVPRAAVGRMEEKRNRSCARALRPPPAPTSTVAAPAPALPSPRSGDRGTPWLRHRRRPARRSPGDGRAGRPAAAGSAPPLGRRGGGVPLQGKRGSDGSDGGVDPERRSPTSAPSCAATTSDPRRGCGFCNGTAWCHGGDVAARLRWLALVERSCSTGGRPSRRSAVRSQASAAHTRGPHRGTVVARFARAFHGASRASVRPETSGCRPRHRRQGTGSAERLKTAAWGPNPRALRSAATTVRSTISDHVAALGHAAQPWTRRARGAVEWRSAVRCRGCARTGARLPPRQRLAPASYSGRPAALSPDGGPWRRERGRGARAAATAREGAVELACRTRTAAGAGEPRRRRRAGSPPPPLASPPPPPWRRWRTVVVGRTTPSARTVRSRSPRRVPSLRRRRSRRACRGAAAHRGAERSRARRHEPSPRPAWRGPKSGREVAPRRVAPTWRRSAAQGERRGAGSPEWESPARVLADFSSDVRQSRHRGRIAQLERVRSDPPPVWMCRKKRSLRSAWPPSPPAGAAPARVPLWARAPFREVFGCPGLSFRPCVAGAP